MPPHQRFEVSRLIESLRFSHPRKLREERRAGPQNDLTITANGLTLPDGSPWPDAAKNSLPATLAPAGIDTTVAAIAFGVEGLIRSPDRLDLVRDEPALIPGLVDESIRRGTPAKVFCRNVTAPVEIGGVSMPVGHRVLVLLASANRDEAVFDAPDAFQVDRSPDPHLSFGHGPHFCLGAHIARTEMRILFEELIPRIESIELAGEPVRARSTVVAGMESLPVRIRRVWEVGRRVEAGDRRRDRTAGRALCGSVVGDRARFVHLPRMAIGGGRHRASGLDQGRHRRAGAMDARSSVEPLVFFRGRYGTFVELDDPGVP